MEEKKKSKIRTINIFLDIKRIDRAPKTSEFKNKEAEWNAEGGK